MNNAASRRGLQSAAVIVVTVPLRLPPGQIPVYHKTRHEQAITDAEFVSQVMQAYLAEVARVRLPDPPLPPGPAKLVHLPRTGRGRMFNEEQVEKIRELYDAGEKAPAIAKRFSVVPATIRRYLKQMDE